MGRNSVENWHKIKSNNLNLHIVNINAYTKLNNILPMHSQHIEQKQTSDINQMATTLMALKEK